MTYTDRDGLPLDMDQWLLLDRDPSYRVVAQVAGVDAEGATTVAWAIWTGKAPEPFEVRVFTGGQPRSKRPAATEAEARSLLVETIRDLGITR